MTWRVIPSAPTHVSLPRTLHSWQMLWTFRSSGFKMQSVSPANCPSVSISARQEEEAKVMTVENDVLKKLQTENLGKGVLTPLHFSECQCFYSFLVCSWKQTNALRSQEETTDWGWGMGDASLGHENMSWQVRRLKTSLLLKSMKTRIYFQV